MSIKKLPEEVLLSWDTYRTAETTPAPPKVKWFDIGFMTSISSVVIGMIPLAMTANEAGKISVNATAGILSGALVIGSLIALAGVWVARRIYRGKMKGSPMTYEQAQCVLDDSRVKKLLEVIHWDNILEQALISGEAHIPGPFKMEVGYAQARVDELAQGLVQSLEENGPLGNRPKVPQESHLLPEELSTASRTAEATTHARRGFAKAQAVKKPQML
jgi:hypothetical protein